MTRVSGSTCINQQAVTTRSQLEGLSNREDFSQAGAGEERSIGQVTSISTAYPAVGSPELFPPQQCWCWLALQPQAFPWFSAIHRAGAVTTPNRFPTCPARAREGQRGPFVPSPLEGDGPSFRQTLSYTIPPFPPPVARRAQKELMSICPPRSRRLHPVVRARSQAGLSLSCPEPLSHPAPDASLTMDDLTP